MSIPLTEIERINALLPTELFAGSKDWQVGSTADRVDWLLTMYSSAKEEVERLQSALEAQQQQELDCVLVPRDLIGAACSAIDRKRDAPKTLEQLRRYTVGDLSTTQPAQPQQEPVGEGWKLVPVEPTEDMWKAVNKLDDEMAAGSYDGKGCSIEQAWNCLLDAAPTPPAQRKPLTDEQIDAAIKAWFENEIVAGRQPFAKRMRAAIKAANSIKE